MEIEAPKKKKSDSNLCQHMHEENKTTDVFQQYWLTLSLQSL